VTPAKSGCCFFYLGEHKHRGGTCVGTTKWWKTVAFEEVSALDK